MPVSPGVFRILGFVIACVLWAGSRLALDGDGRGADAVKHGRPDSGRALERRGASDGHDLPIKREINSEDTVLARVWGPDATLGLVEVPVAFARTKPRPSSNAGSPTETFRKGWFSSSTPSLLWPTMPLGPPIFTPSIDPGFPTATIAPGLTTVRVALRFPDKVPLHDGAIIEDANGVTLSSVAGTQGVVTEFGLQPGVHDLFVRDVGIFELLSPPLTVPATGASVVERNYTVSTVFLRGSVKDTSGNPVPRALIKGVLCPAWLVACDYFPNELRAIAGADGKFSARVSRGRFTKLVALPPHSTGIMLASTRFPDVVVTSDTSVSATLGKAYSVSGMIRRGDGVSSPGSSPLRLWFVSEAYASNPGTWNASADDVDIFLLRSIRTGAFQALLPTGNYSVRVVDDARPLDPRVDMLVPRLDVRQNVRMGRVVLRYGWLRIRIFDGVTSKPPTSGQFHVSVLTPSGNWIYITVAATSGWNGTVDTLTTAPGSAKIGVTGSDPWLDPKPTTAVIVGGNMTVVTVRLPLSRMISGPLKRPDGKVLQTDAPLSIVAVRTRNGEDQFTAEVKPASGRYQIVATPGSYRIILGSLYGLPTGWLRYEPSESLIELKRSVGLGAAQNTVVDIVVPVYTLKVVLVNGEGRPTSVPGTLEAYLVQPTFGNRETKASMDINQASGTSLALTGKYTKAVFRPSSTGTGSAGLPPIRLPDFAIDGPKTITIIVPAPKFVDISGILLLGSGQPCLYCTLYAETSDSTVWTASDGAGALKLQLWHGVPYNITAIAQLGGAPSDSYFPELVGRNIAFTTSISRTFRLPRAITYFGQVADVSGKAVPRAQVEIAGNAESWAAIASADSNGKFRITGLPAPEVVSATVTLHVMNMRSFGIYFANLGKRDLTKGRLDVITAPAPVPLTGRILSSFALKGIRVTAQNSAQNLESKISAGDLSYAVNLWPGFKYRFYADLTTETSRCTSVWFAEDVTATGSSVSRELNVPLVLWTGSVRTPTKKPLVGYIVEATGGRLPGVGDCTASATTDIYGNFRFPMVMGNYTLTISPPFGNPEAPLRMWNEVVGAQGLSRSYVYGG